MGRVEGIVEGTDAGWVRGLGIGRTTIEGGGATYIYIYIYIYIYEWSKIYRDATPYRGVEYHRDMGWSTIGGGCSTRRRGVEFIVKRDFVF